MARIQGNAGNTASTPRVESMSESDNKLIRELLEQNKKLSERLDRLDGPAHDPDEKYSGPRAYSYSTWGNKIVTQYYSVKPESTKDLTYKSRHGELITNHVLKLYFSDGTTETVDVNDYGQNKNLSEPTFTTAITSPKEIEAMNAKDVHAPKGVSFKAEPFYVFEVDGETFEVAQHAIN